MEFTKDEINRFLALAPGYYKKDIRKFLSFDRGHIIMASVGLKDNKHKDNVYATHVMTIYGDPLILPSTFYFRDTYARTFSDETLGFIKQLIKRRLSGIPLIYTNDIEVLYAEDGIAQASIDDIAFKFTSEICISIHGNLFTMTKYDADFSDNFWSTLYSIKGLMMKMAKYYMEIPEYFSPKIQKRIQTYYDSLSDSDKLLLEIGEDLT